MSLFSSVNMLSQAMQNFQTAVNVSGNNISNQFTAGYSQEVVNFSANDPLSLSGLSLGTGASISSVERLRDIYLDSQIVAQTSTAGFYDTSNTLTGRLAAIFPEISNPLATDGLQGAINNLSNSWTALAAAPNSLAAKQTVLQSAEAMAQIFNDDARQLYGLQQNVDAQVGATITKVNSLLDQIDQLNKQIFQATAAAAGAAPNVLLDAREQVEKQLANLVNVQFYQTTGGSVEVQFSQGSLVDATGAHHFTAIPSTTNPGTTGVGFPDKQGQTKDVTAMLTGGSFGAMVQFRDVDLRQVRQQLDEMAFGVTQRSNEINETYVAGDGTTGHDLFTGTKASDIQADTILNSDPAYIGGTRDANHPGDLAGMQAVQKDFVLCNSIATSPGAGINGGGPINPALPILGQVFNMPPFGAPNSVSSPGQIVIVSGGNAVTVKWGVDQSINTILANINTAGGGAFYATFNSQSQRVEIFGSTTLQVYDNGSNLCSVFGLGSYATSSAPVNNSPIAGLNQIAANQNFITVTNLLDYFSKIVKNGQIQVTQGSTVTTYNWTDLQRLNQVLIGLAAANPGLLTSFNPANQVISLFKPGAAPGAANPIASIAMGDNTGNLSQVINFESPQSLDNLFGGLTGGVSAKVSSDALLNTEATNSLASLQSIQDGISKVDQTKEEANITVYQNAFEACVRVQAVLAQMLDLLINNMASSAGTTTRTTS